MWHFFVTPQNQPLFSVAPILVSQTILPRAVLVFWVLSFLIIWASLSWQRYSTFLRFFSIFVVTVVTPCFQPVLIFLSLFYNLTLGLTSLEHWLDFCKNAAKIAQGHAGKEVGEGWNCCSLEVYCSCLMHYHCFDSDSCECWQLFLDLSKYWELISYFVLHCSYLIGQFLAFKRHFCFLYFLRT